MHFRDIVVQSIVSAPWMPQPGQNFEARFRVDGEAGQRWYRCRWHGFAAGDPSRALVEPLEQAPVSSFSVIAEMRPVQCRPECHVYEFGQPKCRCGSLAAPMGGGDIIYHTGRAQWVVDAPTRLVRDATPIAMSGLQRFQVGDIITHQQDKNSDPLFRLITVVRPTGYTWEYLDRGVGSRHDDDYDSENSSDPMLVHWKRVLRGARR